MISKTCQLLAKQTVYQNLTRICAKRTVHYSRWALISLIPWSFAKSAIKEQRQIRETTDQTHEEVRQLTELADNRVEFNEKDVHLLQSTLIKCYSELRMLDGYHLKYSNDPKSLQLIETGLAISKMCIQKANEEMKQKFYKFYALFLHEWSCRQGLTVELNNAHRVKKYMMKSAAALLKQANNDQVLLDVTGRWNLRYIQTPLWKRLIFRKIPNDTSFEEALHCFSRLEKLNPTDQNKLMLIRFLLKAKLADKAKLMLHELENTNLNDWRLQHEIKELLQLANKTKQRFNSQSERE